MLSNERLKEVWREVIIPAYDKCSFLSGYGLSGDPEVFLEEALKGATPYELRYTLGVVAHIKDWDLRLSNSIRQWLYDGVDVTCDDWCTTYVRLLGDLDHIHTSHLNGCAQALYEHAKEGGKG